MEEYPADQELIAWRSVIFRCMPDHHGSSRISRAVVAVPPVRDFYFTRHRFSCLGAHIVAHICRASGIHTELMVFPLAPGKPRTIPIPSSHAHLAPFLVPGETGGTSFFQRYQRFGPDIDKCAEAVAAARPGICLISCFAFCYAEPALELAAAVKRRDPSIRTIIGGAGVSAYPEYFMRREFVDLAVEGEAEPALPVLLSAMRDCGPPSGPIPGLWRKEIGRIIPPVDVRHTVSNDLEGMCVTSRTRKTIHLTTALSRGCPLGCRFCSNHLTHGTKFRVVPMDRLRQSIPAPAADPDAGISINFEDDNLLLDIPHLFAALEEFRTRFPGAGFTAENGMDYRLLTPDLATRLIDAGFRQFNLSLGSTDAAIACREGRPVDMRRYEAVLAVLAQRKIPSITYFICGLPGDTRETTASQLAYLARSRTLCGISLFYPVPGIGGFEDRSLFDKVSPSLCAGSAAYPWSGSLDTRALVTAFRLSRFINLRKKPALSDAERRMAERIESERRLYTMIKGKSGLAIVPVPLADEELVRLFFEMKAAGEC